MGLRSEGEAETPVLDGLEGVVDLEELPLRVPGDTVDVVNSFGHCFGFFGSLVLVFFFVRVFLLLWGFGVFDRV